MLERFERPLKILCAGMALLVAWQIASMFLRGDPLKNLKIPPLPALPGGTNDEAKASDKTTNAPKSQKAGTNAAALAVNTTNEIPARTGATNGTNKVSVAATNANDHTNIARATNALSGTNIAGATNRVKETNFAESANAAKVTNLAAKSDKAPPLMPPGARPGARGPAPKKMELPALVKARVDRIIESEILGAIPHPMPLSLNGILDDKASIQATNGQTEWVKEGGELAGVKLLRIGINRVLVEDHGEKKELTLFGGVGGESLMPPPTHSPAADSSSTNAPSTNAPPKGPRMRVASSGSTNLSSKQKDKQ